MAAGILFGQCLDLARYRLDALVEPAPVDDEGLDEMRHAGRELVCARKDDRQLRSQWPRPLADSDAALEQKSPDLVDDTSALRDETFAHAMQRLQIQLLNGFGGDELHRRPLNRLGNSFRVAIVVLLPV